MNARAQFSKSGHPFFTDRIQKQGKGKQAYLHDKLDEVSGGNGDFLIAFQNKILDSQITGLSTIRPAGP